MLFFFLFIGYFLLFRKEWDDIFWSAVGWKDWRADHWVSFKDYSLQKSKIASRVLNCEENDTYHFLLKSENRISVYVTSLPRGCCLFVVWALWYIDFCTLSIDKFCLYIYIYIYIKYIYHPGSGHIDTAIWMHYMDYNKTAGEELDGNYTRMLRAILNKFWRQHPTRHQLYDHYHENYSS